MPHINRIRVNNVKYNFGTQFYDDFVLRLSGKNTIYDLANGGGKSVLMLLLLQNLIPNCTLDDKQPVEKLFRTANGSTTIHSLIEWRLNKNDVKNGFRYMTTGFCARKAKDSHAGEEGVKDTAAIEYFNYCIFYREFGDNDIRNLPLSNGAERITYNGLKSYLRELEKKDFGVQVKVFERKGDYQRFISEYGLYESEWEIIRGINKTEGHVRTYFETAYRTTRKVVEDLLIEEIIQKSFYNKTSGGESEGTMADVLLDIKDKLSELSQKKSEIAGYERQKEVLEDFVGRIQTLKAIYENKAGIEEKLLRTYHTGIHRSAGKQAALEGCRADGERLIEEKRNAERLLAAARIRMEEQELLHLLAGRDELSRRLKRAEEGFEKQERSLSLLESANDYFDYLDYKKQYESSRVAIETMEGKNEKLLEELHALAFLWKHRLDNKREEHAFEMNALMEELEKTAQELSALREEEREAYRSHIIQENSLHKLLEERKENEAKLLRLQNEGIVSFGTELAQKDISGAKRLKEQLEAELAKKEEQEAQLTESIESSRLRLAGVRNSAESITDRLEEDRSFLNAYREKKVRAESLKEVYHAADEQELFARLKEAGRRNASEAAALKAGEADLNAQLARLKEGRPADTVSHEHIRKLCEYIERCHGVKAVAGEAYMAALPAEERKAVLEANPILPYGVLLDGGLKSVASDMQLREKDYGGGIIPIFEKKDVEECRSLEESARVVFKTADRELYYLPEKLSARIQKQEEELKELKERLDRLAADEGVIAGDLAFTQTFYEYYLPKKRQCQEKYDEGKRRLKLLAGQEQELEAAQQEAGQSLKAVRQELADGKKRLAKFSEYILYAERAGRLTAWLHEAAARKRRLEEEKEKAGMRLTKAADSRKEKEESLAGLEQRARNMEGRLNRLEEDWQKLYRPYYKEGIYPPMSYTPEELESAFFGRKEVFEQKNADAADKQRLMESYKKGMDKCREAIEYRGISIEELKQLCDKGELSVSAKDKLLEKKRKLLEEKEQIVLTRSELERSSEAVHKKQGSISHARALMEETYGPGEPEGLLEEDYALLVQENESRKKELSSALKENARAQKELESQCYALEAMKEDMERMLHTFGIEDREDIGLLEPGVSLKKEYSDLRERYEGLKREEHKRREGFERDKLMLTDTLTKLGAIELAEELKYRMGTPDSLPELEEQIAGVKKTQSFIELEKERISKGIVDMERIRDTFENQCLQTCVNIRTELERLPKLSRIYMDNHQISMITLNIPYRREEQLKDAMSAYIDEVVKGADDFSSQSERLRYLRSRLAWKKLFSVIVTDMDAIKLNLYKRERIKEQSRYLKYEEAVGSTGQSQGIYIQFLVAVINYITSINSRNADPKDLKKVIFIDNPFGAAKDVYIWEPIFKLLKANNVQLIVPARGATPALTGRFEVNYVLGQRLIDGRQQTVIVDYRSQTDSEELEYRRLEYEQSALLFE